MNVKKISLFAFLIFSFPLWGADARQFLLDDSELKNKLPYEEGETENSPFISGERGDKYSEEKVKESPHIPETYADEMKKKIEDPSPEINDYGFTQPGEFNESKSYKEYSNREVLEKRRGLGKKAFTFVLSKNDIDYTGGSTSFDNTFRTSPGNDPSLMMTLGFDYYFKRGFIDWAWGGNLTIAYNGGLGRFTTVTAGESQVSETKFHFWTFPLDLSLTGELPLGKFGKLGLSLGPSAVILYQRRSDLTENDSRKDQNLLGYGYFAKALAKIDLGRIFSQKGIDHLRSYDVSQWFLTLEIRTQNYEQFIDKKFKSLSSVAVDGNSFGAGFTYEFL